MEQTGVEQLIADLEVAVDRLRSLYDQYFMGIEKLEPAVARKELDRRVHVLRKEQIRNTALRFRFQMVLQRYNTFQSHWARICREIENGTYKRHLNRAERRFGQVPTGRSNRTSESPASLVPTEGSDELATVLPVHPVHPVHPVLPVHPVHPVHPVLPAPPLRAPGMPASPVAPALVAPKVSGPPPLPRGSLPAQGPGSMPVRAATLGGQVASLPGAPIAAGLRAELAELDAAFAAPGSPPPRRPPPVPARPAASLPAAASPAASGFAPPPAASGSLSDERVRQLYVQYVEAKRRQNESTAAITYDAVARSLRESSAKLREKHGKPVDFEVTVREGKAVLKPVLK